MGRARELALSNMRMSNAKYTVEQQAENSFLATLPIFNIKYRDLIFSESQSIYQSGRKGNNPGDAQNENAVYTDLGKQQTVQKSMQFDD